MSEVLLSLSSLWFSKVPSDFGCFVLWETLEIQVRGLIFGERMLSACWTLTPLNVFQSGHRGS